MEVEDKQMFFKIINKSIMDKQRIMDKLKMQRI